ncbi:hypothetical protein Pelo_14554 [Pelomyxa schiedti]|nr:hypothetical protein Pelo_14549 [Pelomyxa schiedti]KAH3744054.1 hypothetical protein Pelo_14554 [Pelomyxa schiedti]
MSNLKSQQSSTTMPPVWKQRQERSGYILSVSLTVWRDIVPLAVPTGVRGEWRVDDCVGLMALAEALFPLVPRACNAVMGAGAVEESVDDDGGHETTKRTVVVVHTSRYFGLRCAGLAGSKRCAEWIVGHAVRTRNNNKECLTVLKGLCAGMIMQDLCVALITQHEGGHLEVAHELVDGSSYYFKSLRWPRINPDVTDSIREMSETCHSLLFEACRGGSLDTVKWVMSRFSGVGTADLELIKPFLCAVRRGHVDIVKWLASTTAVLVACRNSPLRREELCGSASVEVVKMCTQWFFGTAAERRAALGFEVLLKYMELAEQRDCIEFEEGCQWIKDTFDVPIGSPLLSVKSYKGLKWVLDNYLPPKSDLMNFSSKFLLADEEIVSSYITDLWPVTPQDLVAACGNEKDNVETVKFILSMTTTAPTLKCIRECLVQALLVNNTSIAKWLESTFRVMRRLKHALNTDDTLWRIARGNPGSRGTQWFLSHANLPSITPITERTVSLLRRKPQEFWAFLDALPVARRYRVYTVTCAVESWTLSQTQHFVSPESGYDAEKISRGLKSCRHVQSGKVVKWLIQTFSLTSYQVASVSMLRILIESNKIRCAEWLIHTFKITLAQVTPMLKTFQSATTKISVPMWKMLLRVFPQITAEFAKEHLMQFVFMSPLHTTVSIRTLGLSKDDILARRKET